MGPTTTFTWDEPKDPHLAPRGADVLDRGIAHAVGVVGDEVASLRRRAERVGASAGADELLLMQRIARLSDLLGAFHDAEDAALQAATLARIAQDADAELDALDTAAAARSRLGQLDAASELEAEVRKRATTDSHLAIRTLLHSAVLRAASADIDSALGLLDEAFRLARQRDDPGSSGHILNNAAILLAVHGCSPEAERLLQRAIVLRQRSGDLRGLGHTYNNLGLLSQKRGNLSGAIPFLEMSAVLLAEAGDLPALVIALSNNVVVFEQHYLDPARTLRQTFASAIAAVKNYLPLPPPDANVVRFERHVRRPPDEASTEREWGVIAEGAALLSTHRLEPETR